MFLLTNGCVQTNCKMWGFCHLSGKVPFKTTFKVKQNGAKFKMPFTFYTF